ncbi:ATP-binding protein [Calidifontibacillus oryziterrae]|uniref:ATP-binding protein n=1 Tax=Calidifontibacillus oryziterrae TaxID=1191699 RepID=UPI00031B8030|nr:ATP-binding protein [Calidifontibacillus oryziterrae]
MINIQVECKANVESINYFNQLCERALELINWKEIRSVAFALNEAIINAVEATQKKYGMSTVETVIVHMQITSNVVDIQVIDKAGGMSDEQIKLLEKREFRDVGFSERGRGILFMKKLMDQVHFQKQENGVFIVQLKKTS